MIIQEKYDLIKNKSINFYINSLTLKEKYIIFLMERWKSTGNTNGTHYHIPTSYTVTRNPFVSNLYQNECSVRH